MLSDLIPHMARHFVHEVIQYNCENGANLIDATTRLPPLQIAEFLCLVAGYLEGYFHALEEEIEGYDKIKAEALTTLKNYPEDVEEMN